MYPIPLTYLSFCKQRLWLEQKKRHSFIAAEVVDALEAVFAAMLSANEAANEGERRHSLSFFRQIRQLGLPDTLEEEPYLVIEQANQERLFIQRLETLFTQLEAYLRQGKKGFYDPEGIEWKRIERQMEWKAFDSHSSLLVQVEARLEQETLRLHERIDQRLREQRMRALGLDYLCVAYP